MLGFSVLMLAKVSRLLAQYVALCSVPTVQEEAYSEMASRDESAFPILTFLSHGGS